jgi:O-antigen ligase
LITTTEQILLLGIWLVMVMNLFFTWQNFVSPGGDALGDAHTEPDKLSHVILSAIYFVIVFLTLCRLKIVLKTLLQNGLLLALCLWILLSITWGTDPGTAMSAAIRFIVLVVFSAYITSRYDTIEFVGFLTRGFAICVLASFAVMVLVPRLGHSNIGGGYENAWRGAFTHKNWLGSAMSVGVVVAAYSYRLRANSRLLTVFTFLGGLVLLVMARSATSLIATLVAFLAAVGGLALQSEGRRSPLRGIALFGIGAMILVILIFPLLDIEIGTLPKFIGRSSDLTGRSEVWRAVKIAIHDRPLTGYGYGFWSMPSVTRSNIWAIAGWEVPHAHNTWLDCWLQLGVVGVFLTACVWSLALWRALWLTIVSNAGAALFFLTILLGCLSRSFAETVIFAPALTSLFWLVTSSMYLGQIRRARRGEARMPAPQQRSDSPLATRRPIVVTKSAL